MDLFTLLYLRNDYSSMIGLNADFEIFRHESCFKLYTKSIKWDTALHELHLKVHFVSIRLCENEICPIYGSKKKMAIKHNFGARSLLPSI